MKKYLLASTALVAASLLGSQQASAQTSFSQPGSPPATTQNLPPVGTAAPAAQGPRFVIRITGFFWGAVAGSWQNDVGPSTLNAQNFATTGGFSTSPFNNAHQTRVQDFLASRMNIRPEISLDNGFTAGGLLQWNTDGGSFTSRQTYAFLQSARFGLLRIGNQNLALTEMEYREPSVARGYDTTFVDSTLVETLMVFPSGGNNGSALLSPDQGLAGIARANGISYYTPRIEGFQIGASFVPELNQNRRNIDNEAGNINGNGSRATYRNAWEAAVNFDRTFDPGVRVQLSGGYARAYNPDQGGQGSSLGSPAGVGLGGAAPNPYWWYVGGRVGYAGFTVGGSYGRSIFRDFQQGNNNLGGGLAPTFFNTLVADGYAWTLGASYQYGPWGIAIAYMDARNSDCSTTALAVNACGSRDRNTIISAVGSYQLGPGVFVELGYFHAKNTGNEWNSGTFVGTTPVGTGGVITTTASGVAQAGLQSNRIDAVYTGLAIQF
jgi:predicted porin